ncbi:MAG: hemolysin III family protein [Planctomycetota bacterium]
MDPQNNIHLVGVADPVAAGTHLLGFFATLGGLSALLRRTAARPYERTLVLIFGAATAIQYLASTVYHTFQGEFLRRIDHATIYVLIAGTYMPLAGSHLPPHLRVAVLTLIWVFGVSGIVLKLFFFDFVHKYEYIDVILYLVAGWLGTIPTFFIWRRGDRGTTAWIMAGAILYTAGALFELFGWPKIVARVFNFHEVFHLCVMAASVSFFAAVWRITLPPPRT